jgi:hypothetical protein
MNSRFKQIKLEMCPWDTNFPNIQMQGFTHHFGNMTRTPEFGILHHFRQNLGKPALYYISNRTIK